MAVSTFNKSGNKSTMAAKLDKKVFGVDTSNHELLKEVYVAYLANGRINLAKSKTRGQVRGGGRKPWRQKGTGRARFGSSRNPIWRGGGSAFGPTGQENYTHRLNTNAKRQAVRQALSLAAEADSIIVIESLESKDGITKTAINLLNKINATGRILLVVDKKDSLIARATGNLSNVKTTQATYLNVFDILNSDHIVITVESLGLISEWLGDKK